MKSLKSIMSVILAIVLVLFCTVPVFAKTGSKTLTAVYSGIKIIVNGSNVSMSSSNEPFVSNGVTYLPVRLIGTALGKNVSWDAKTKVVSITTPKENLKQPASDSNYKPLLTTKQLNVSYNDIKITVDGKQISINAESEPFISSGVTYLPLRAVGEALNLKVDWNGNTKTVTMTNAVNTNNSTDFSTLMDDKGKCLFNIKGKWKLLQKQESIFVYNNSEQGMLLFTVMEMSDANATHNQIAESITQSIALGYVDEYRALNYVSTINKYKTSQYACSASMGDENHDFFVSVTTSDKYIFICAFTPAIGTKFANNEAKLKELSEYISYITLV